MIYDKLTKREKEVLNYAIDGRSNDEIARLLFLSYGRVAAIFTALYRKYNIYQSEERVNLVLIRLKEMGKI